MPASMTIARIVPVLLGCLLACVSTASAECAWVLWERFAGISGTEDRVIAARSSEQECRALVQPTVKRRTDVAGKPGPSGRKPNVTVEAESSVVLQREASILTWSYTCLPDTVDPRGPKGR